MQTLTTVGYGDITLGTLSERVMSIFILFIGVIVFSFASGSLTNIIANQDKNKSRNFEKKQQLNKIHKNFNIPNDLYYQLLQQTDVVDDLKTLEETHNFLESLPYRMKVKVVLQMFEDIYLKVDFLKKKSEHFLTWICPVFK